MEKALPKPKLGDFAEESEEVEEIDGVDDGENSDSTWQMPHSELPNLAIPAWCDAVSLTGFAQITTINTDYTWNCSLQHIYISSEII